MTHSISDMIRHAMVVKPLVGHTSMETAYEVDDYPYGRLRTKKRFWLEQKGKKGWRFVEQTLNPKNGRWNKPKTNTYTEFAASMYLDEKGHVQWAGLSAYSSAEEVLDFVTKFPKSDKSYLKKFTPAKIKYLEKRISGEIVQTMNGKPVPVTDRDLDRWKKELETWRKIASKI